MLEQVRLHLLVAFHALIIACLSGRPYGCNILLGLLKELLQYSIKHVVWTKLVIQQYTLAELRVVTSTPQDQLTFEITATLLHGVVAWHETLCTCSSLLSTCRCNACGEQHPHEAVQLFSLCDHDWNIMGQKRILNQHWRCVHRSSHSTDHPAKRVAIEQLVPDKTAPVWAHFPCCGTPQYLPKISFSTSAAAQLLKKGVSPNTKVVAAAEMTTCNSFSTWFHYALVT